MFCGKTFVFVVLLGWSTVESALHAVLVSGSHHWDNYRHQADICHAYQVLVSNNVPPENIIVMMYDDIARHPSNPFPGKVFNSRRLVDVYSGISVDYRGPDVTVDNFQKVLLGIPTGIGRVLNTGPEDNVFVFFSNHGNTGFVGFPNQEVLTVRTLKNTLDNMISRSRFGNMLIFVEACYSGSLFRGQLSPASRTNERETSFGSTDSINDRFGYRVVLGDAFSVNWISFAKSHDLERVTIEEQFEAVRRLTLLSHVQNFGDVSIGQMPVSQFLGFAGTKRTDEVKHRIDSAAMDLFVQFESRLRTPQPRLDPRLPPEVITELDCHHHVITEFVKRCPRMTNSDYKNHFIATVTNLCEQGIPPEDIAAEMRTRCF